MDARVRNLLVALVALGSAAALRGAPPAVRESESDAEPYTIVRASKKFDANEAEEQAKNPKYVKRSFAAAKKEAFGYVAADGYDPRSWPAKTAPASGAAALPFLARVKILLDIQGDREFTLVGDPGGDVGAQGYAIYGWVPARSIVQSNICLRDDVTKIYRKAIVLNSADYIRSLKDKPDSVPDDLRPPKAKLSIEGGAGTEKSLERELAFFQFFYIWADTDTKSDSSGFVLLGENPAYSTSDSRAANPLREQAKVFGWIPKRRLCFWNTSEGVEWDTGAKLRGPALGYRELADAEKAAEGKAGGKSTEIESFADKRPIPWTPRMMRYPRLDIPGVDGEGKAITRPAVTGLPDKNALYRIGIIGDVVGDENRTVSRVSKQDFNQEVANIRSQLKRTEILFVMDRTTSMEKWYRVTRDAVLKLIKSVDGKERKLSVAFCYYSDLWEGDREGKATKKEALAAKPPRIVATKLMPVESGPDSPLMKELETLRQIAQPDEERKPGDAGLWTGGDHPEMLYAGLEHGLETVGWSAYSRKMVVLIGDCGNHPLGAEADADVQKNLVKLLRPSGKSPIEFYALHTYDKTDNRDKRRAFDLFRSQMTDLVKALVPEPAKRTKYDCPADYFDLEADESKFLKMIGERYVHLKERADELDRNFSRVQNGSGRVDDPEVIAALKSIARRSGRAENEWTQLVEGIQPFDVQYVLELDPRTKETQLRKKILVSRADIESITTAMFNDLFHPNRPELKRQKVMELVVNAMKRESDTVDLNAMTKKEFLGLNMLGLSFQAEMYELWKSDDAAKWGELLFKLQIKHERLKDILAEQKREIITEKADGKNVLKFGAIAPLAKEERRGFTQGDGSEIFYWLDLLEEWP